MKFLAQASFYDVLGVELSATAEEVEKAYTARVSELPHTSWRRFLLQALTGRSEHTLVAARATLTSAEKRAAHDALLKCSHFWIPIQ